MYVVKPSFSKALQNKLQIIDQLTYIALISTGPGNLFSLQFQET